MISYSVAVLIDSFSPTDPLSLFLRETLLIILLFMSAILTYIGCVMPERVAELFIKGLSIVSENQDKSGHYINQTIIQVL